MSKQEQLTIKAVGNLVSHYTPSELQSWLFDMQNEIVANSHKQSYSESASSDIASKFAVVKQFFEAIGSVK